MIYYRDIIFDMAIETGLYILKLLLGITGVLAFFGVIHIIVQDSYNIISDYDMESHLIGSLTKKHRMMEYNPYKEDFELWCVNDELTRSRGHP